MNGQEAMEIFDRHGLTGRVPYIDTLIAEALKKVEAERDEARALLAAARSALGAAVHELEVGEASDFLDGTIRVPRRQAEEYKRAAADLTWVRVSLRELLGELAVYEEKPAP